MEGWTLHAGALDVGDDGNTAAAAAAAAAGVLLSDCDGHASG